MISSSPATCTHNLKVGEPAFLQTFSHRGYDAQQVFTVQTGASPKIPTIGISREIPKLNVAAICWFLPPLVPSGR